METLAEALKRVLRVEEVEVTIRGVR